MSNFYGTEIEIWAGFGPVGNTEKNGVDHDGGFVHVSGVKFFFRFKKNIVASTLKMMLRNQKKNL